MSSAIVTGATGILGREIVRALGQDPAQWTVVHALSRSQKDEYPKNVKHDAVDLTGDCTAMAKQLQGVEGEYVFFSAYLQKDTEQENWDVNGDMLKNFIDALAHTGALKKVKRFVLVTGCKQYGLHLGRPKNPMLESDPRIDGPGRPPNFYYRQEDILAEAAARHSFEWVVTFPNDVIGLAGNNFMNLATTLALYALVSRELGGALAWPGSQTFYHCATAFTESKLHARFCLWAAREPRAANQAFNVVNGEAECWESLWPQLAAYFGTHVPADQFAQPADPQAAYSAELDPKPPLADLADSVGLRGSGALGASLLEARIDVVKWAQREDVRQAWAQVAEREGLDHSAFDKAPWWFLRFELGRNFPMLISMSKARKLGWTGYQDSWDAFEGVFRGLEDLKVLPRATANKQWHT